MVNGTASILPVSKLKQISDCGLNSFSVVLQNSHKSPLPSASDLDLESTQKEDDQPRDREGKFLLYWMTTTSTSTTYTATTTVSSLACTPSGFVISNCSG